MNHFLVTALAAASLFTGMPAISADAPQSNGDGVTVLPQAPQPSPPKVPPVQSVQLDNGDIITVQTGMMLIIQRDPTSGTYQIGVKVP